MDPNQGGQRVGFLYRWFFFVAFAQFTLLMTLAILGPGSARKASPYLAENKVLCEDQKSDEIFVSLNFPMFPLHCEGKACLHSRYVQPESDSELETHVVAVEGGVGPLRAATWPHIEVLLQATSKPVRLVLSSKESVQWDLKGVGESLLQEVHIVTPRASRISGISDRSDIALYWHGEDTLCLYPYSWWDRDNPNNEYQRFIAHLRVLLGAEEDSFQGAERGVQFEVPFYDSREDEVRHVLNFRKKWNPSGRLPASTSKDMHVGPIYRIVHHSLRDQGWGKVSESSREAQLLEPIPADRTFLSRRADGKYHLLSDGPRLLLYSPELKQEIVVPPPHDMADFQRLHLASFHGAGKSILAYFQEFGGVVREWLPKENKWEHRLDLYRQELDQWLWEEDGFWGLSLYKSTATLMKFDQQGRKIQSKAFLLPWELSKRRTRILLEKTGEEFLLKHYSASAPDGRWFLLNPVSGSVQILSP